MSVSANRPSLAVAGGKHPCFPPCFKKGIKAEFGYDSRRGFSPCIADPPGLVPFRFLGSSVSSPGRSVTRARGLYVSRLANFRVSDPRYGAEHRTCEAANAPGMAHLAGTPLPKDRSLNG